jgi:hypothetical protein
MYVKLQSHVILGWEYNFLYTVYPQDLLPKTTQMASMQDQDFSNVKYK